MRQLEDAAARAEQLQRPVELVAAREFEGIEAPASYSGALAR
jgi:hypothetical protein